ncbi:unnamed protein product [Mytilus coruscus]|uniref:C-type lectin domain-containing protein n=1 Tax=Mytilus coruscus TaxID=42192 RepID=A0A6J8BUQ3_MYTCO|nr:unnamed protein product [Mytilus coruscus]
MNEKVWIVIFAYVIDIKCVNAKSVSYNQAYHSERQTWKSASDECGSNGLEFDEKVLTNIEVLNDKVFWIGMAIYHVTTPWIEILGCFAVPDGQEVKKSPSIVLCQKQCEPYQFFGYSESTEICSCLHVKGCMYSIRNCIEQNNSTYFFVYKVYSGNVSDNDNGKCTTLYCLGGNNGLTTASCNDTNSGTASACNNGSVVGWGKPYSTSKQMCLDNYQLLLAPETYCRLKGHENEGHLSWTNVYRAETEAKLTQAEAGTKEPLYCLAGSFTENNAKKEFNITRRFCNDQLDYFVCRTGTASSTTSKQRVNAVKITEKFSSTKRASGVQNCEASTTTSQTIIATKKMKKDSNDSFDIGPAIGGITAAVILIAVFLVMFFCKIRSCGFFKTTNIDKQGVPFSTAVYEHSPNPEGGISLTPTSNESYGFALVNSVHTYAVVNKSRKKDSNLQNSDKTYTETSHGEYDRFNGVSKRQTDSKENLYDSHAGIRNESDPTYDSSNHGGRKIQFDNDVYDHTDTLSTDGRDYGYSSNDVY